MNHFTNILLIFVLTYLAIAVTLTILSAILYLLKMAIDRTLEKYILGESSSTEFYIVIICGEMISIFSYAFVILFHIGILLYLRKEVIKDSNVAVLVTATLLSIISPYYVLSKYFMYYGEYIMYTIIMVVILAISLLTNISILVFDHIVHIFKTDKITADDLDSV